MSISAITPDWSREKPRRYWDPSRRLLASIRRYQRWSTSRNPIAKLVKNWSVLCHRFWSIVCGCDIPINSQLGGGLQMEHPCGIVIHPDAVVGVNCLLLQQVILTEGVILEGHVDVGCGAKIIRPAQKLELTQLC